MRLERPLDPARRITPSHARADLLVVAERVLGVHRVGRSEPGRQQLVGEQGQA